MLCKKLNQMAYPNTLELCVLYCRTYKLFRSMFLRFATIWIGCHIAYCFLLKLFIIYSLYVFSKTELILLYFFLCLSLMKEPI